MMIEQLKAMHDFTNSEKTIASYLIKPPDNIFQLSAEELAKVTFTSKSTLLRLCKKVGCSSYRQFMHELEIEWRERKQLQQLIEKEPINEMSTYMDLIDIVPSIYEKAIRETKMNLDKNMMQRIINYLSNASEIMIYGSGITEAIANQAAFKWRSIGIPCNVYTGLNEHYILSLKNRQNRCAVLLSFTGNNREMLHIAKYLKKAGIHVVGIGSRQGKLKTLCHEFVGTYPLEQILSLEVMTAFTSHVYILDIMFACLLSKNYQKNVEAALCTLHFSKEESIE